MKPFAQAAIALGLALVCASPATAQFGNPFEQPPRPPASVPIRPQPQVQQQAPPQASPQWQGQPTTPLNPPPATPGPSLRPGAVQSEDLPPVGGAQSVALPPAGGAMAPPGQVPPPGQRQPRAGLPSPTAPAAAAPAPPPPTADVVTVPPPQRISNPTAVFSGLDKITGRITAFDAAIGETVQFGALQVTARACYSRPPTETPLTDGFVEVDEVTLKGEVRRIFTGWMFAASPGLHAVEHPIYDVWLVDCKGGAQAVAETQPATPAAAPPRQGTSQQRASGAQQRQQPRR
ncbi:MAG TPA: DUF2155 domain-containing protein [Xanthobacteraceae bacterium]|jgi:hypothetical protein|nr:DUF2155 domain-containing protein [Xanthobacteraceae bacterium]